MIPLIKHNFAQEVIVPLGAISYNIDVLRGVEKKIVTSDNVECVIQKIEEIHALSTDAESLILRLYNINPYTYLKIWNKKISISGLWLAYIKLKKSIYVETEELSGGYDKGDQTEVA